MVLHPFDYELQNNIYVDLEVSKIYDEKIRVKRWIEIESVIAKVQGDLGIIPKYDAEVIVNVCKFENLDYDKIVNDYKNSKNTLAPVLNSLYQLCGESSQYLHYGVTTQDIIDTGEMLGLKKSLNIIFRSLNKLSYDLTELTKKHKKSAMVGRTHGQHALPITFGLKTAIWLDEINRHKSRIYNSYNNIYGQLGGAVGTLAAMPKADIVKKKVMECLGLSYSLSAWHNARDRVAETATCLTLLSTTLSKIANEIILLGYTEINEVREGEVNSDVVNSSAMPHKHNPVLCQRIVAMATQNRALLSVVIENMAHSHERDPRNLWSEWISLPQIIIYTSAILENMLSIFKSLHVDVEKMQKNLYESKDTVVSEALMYNISKEIGKLKAHKLLMKINNEQLSSTKTITELLTEHNLTYLLDAKTKSIIDNPEKYIGQAENVIDSVLKTTVNNDNIDSLKLKEFNITPIGIIHTKYNKLESCPMNTRYCECDSVIEIFNEYHKALKKIEQASHLFCLYWLDKADRDYLQGISKLDGTNRGAFSTRTPNRPNPIGIGIVKLKEIKGNKLFVSGLDCLNGTMLIDLKPYISENDSFLDAKIRHL
ncbi:tRNA (N6-threonylcarbamoyladenosine(37)-N6)-methyltransferase TrmO [Salmonella enterica]|nr:tRNA (N6-threonylcarbamoyladenosine(37)-N6)-methyltransferase TrmO [Salmonella enterica]HAO3760630.1 tRNA (N6-threonylcarbamoyladenosine(37)-N6)-methyltransferase TrmO [Salmonella enterica]